MANRVGGSETGVFVRGGIHINPADYIHTAFAPLEVRQLAEEADQTLLSGEGRYRYYERLGILAGADKPTDWQVSIAWREAREYDATAANPPEPQTGLLPFPA
jgi:hypothetical protein